MTWPTCFFPAGRRVWLRECEDGAFWCVYCARGEVAITYELGTEPWCMDGHGQPEHIFVPPDYPLSLLDAYDGWHVRSGATCLWR